MIYLASPYSHRNPLIQSFRAKCARDALVYLTERGMHVYSPIATWHPITHGPKYDRPSFGTDERFWRAHNETFLRNSSELRVLELPGVDESDGVRHEIAYAMVWGIPIWRGLEPPDSLAWRHLNGIGYGTAT